MSFESIIHSWMLMRHLHNWLGKRSLVSLMPIMAFWQIQLAKQLRSLTTFIAPFGWFQFNKLPFGIYCAPKLFQKHTSTMLSELQWVLCLMDDVLVFGSTWSRAIQQKAWSCAMQNTVTLNLSKCEFWLSSLVTLSTKMELELTQAVVRLSPPSNVKEMRWFVGMVNQLVIKVHTQLCWCHTSIDRITQH